MGERVYLLGYIWNIAAIFKANILDQSTLNESNNRQPFYCNYVLIMFGTTRNIANGFSAISF